MDSHPIIPKYDLNAWEFYLNRIEAGRNFHEDHIEQEQCFIRKCMEDFHREKSSRFSEAKINPVSGPLDELFDYLDWSNLERLQDTLYDYKDETQLLKELTNCKVLVITANDVERNILHRQIHLMNSDEKIVRIIAGQVAYFIFHWGNYKIAHVHQYQIGGHRDYGLRSTLEEVLHFFRPNVIFSMGVAFGIDPKSQNIGDVLVSQKVFPYSENKIVDGHIYPDRSQDRHIDPWLQVRFVNTTGFLESVTFGSILSGTSVLSSVEDKERFCRAYSKNDFVIGGEMEGSALFQICGSYGIPCAVIKGICDWGGEKNSVYPGEAEKEVHLKTCAQAFAMTKVVEKCSILFRDHTLFAHPKSRSYETQRRISQSLVYLLIISNLLFLILGFIILAYFPEVRELPVFAHPRVLVALQACLVILITIAYVEYWKKQDQRFPTLDRTII